MILFWDLDILVWSLFTTERFKKEKSYSVLIDLPSLEYALNFDTFFVMSLNPLLDGTPKILYGLLDKNFFKIVF